ncbi:hypothetical protein HELRODRAFT_84286 [Helobdella robusta]|uniref:THUMP domain-containing protein n=1 Tax=Helobdella robusta TaxID=6412 RepID=T1G5H0_HELRO|nr:hypothetical protein HELRODRAFT_84286 [Helobdella robusta]ESN99561.1 hypothetical protein HELRODRAFT_84286 [Helobdella robusta]
MSQDRKRKNKNYYVQSKKPKNEFNLDSGMKGFFITCNYKESRAVTEAYKILNEYADNIYGPTEVDQKSVKDQFGEEDIDASLSNHVNSYKNKSLCERRFQNVCTKTNNCIFIKTSFENPNEIIEKIFSDAQLRLVQSRFVLRFLPVLGTCRVAEDKLEKLAEDVIEDYSKLNKIESSFKYCIIHKIRCNNKLNKEIILSVMNRAVKRKFPDAKIDLNEPDIVFSVDILLKVCCLSVLKKFNEFKKYNLFEISNGKNGAPKINEPHGSVDEHDARVCLQT